MSATIVLLPLVAGAWPVYAQLVTTVAVSMGYRLIQNMTAEAGVNAGITATAGAEEVCEVPIESTQKIVATMKDGDKLAFANGDFVVTFAKDPRGTCKCEVKCAPGKRHSKSVLNAEAKKIINKVTQAYVYNKLKTELTQRGYNITNDEAREDDSIHISVRKWK